MSKRLLPGVHLLSTTHAVQSFDCGVPALNEYLIKYALTNQQNGSARTYVALTENSEVNAYFTLAAGSVAFEDTPQRILKGLARHPVPVLLLARLAVDKSLQGRGAGASLVKHAMLKTLQASEIIGIRGLLVHANDDQAKAFYQQFDFVPSPTHPLHLFVLLEDIKKTLEQ